MNILYQKFVDWEPLIIRLETRPSGPVDVKTLKTVVEEWAERRSNVPVCNNECVTKFLDVREINAEITIFIEWVCKDCVRSLLAVIESKYPQISAARLGYDESPDSSFLSDNKKFIAVGPRSIRIENAEIVRIEPFQIRRAPISVGEYEHFAAATGYVTSAERLSQRQTYRINDLLYGIDANNRDTYSACFLSYADSWTFCEHKNLRLPTDIELLAAITVDDTIRDLSGEDRATLYRESANILLNQGRTITSTLVGEKVIARSGPWVTKHPGWEQSTEYRRMYEKNEPVPRGQFYVVKNLPPVRHGTGTPLDNNE